MKEVLELILVRHAHLVLFALLAFVYLVKRHYDYRIKKLEISRSLFQQRKLDAITAFFSAAAKVQMAQSRLPLLKIAKGAVGMPELDKMILPALNKLRAAVNNLEIYYDEDINANCGQVLQNYLQVTTHLAELDVPASDEEDAMEKAHKVSLLMDLVNRENNSLLKSIGKEVRKTYTP